ncbi:3',5'-cyclic-nucleotide phosphodiesterase pde1 [Trapelia coarctata]|nr:3',5'-cyclic-nucleotide phosphodiesterase pde1 [Trapelia coarctata]
MRGDDRGSPAAGEGEGEAGDHGPAPAFQIIVLGAGGGPSEDDVTGLLVRSTATQWAKGSILAVDAGTHLAAITRILKEHQPHATRTEPIEYSTPILNQPWKWRETRKLSALSKSSGSSDDHSPAKALPNYFAPVSEAKGTRAGSPGPPKEPPKTRLALNTGPFTGLILPYETPNANAAYLLRNLISTYLITHPHLDHLSGFAINTASFQHTSRPKKVAALPSTINAIKSHIFNDVIWPNLSDEEGGVGLVSYMRLVEGGNIALGDGDGRGYIELCDGLAVKAWSVSHGNCMKRHSHRGSSIPPAAADAMYPSVRRASYANASPSAMGFRRGSLSHIEQESVCVYDSSAFFIRDETTGREILVFGDVEPDSISLSPRTARVWADAARKIVAGTLSALFIECSYDDSQSDETLFGHLAPRHLIAELQVLAHKVGSVRRGSSASSEGSRRGEGGTPTAEGGHVRYEEGVKKRKRLSNGVGLHEEGRRGRTPWRGGEREREGAGERWPCTPESPALVPAGTPTEPAGGEEEAEAGSGNGNEGARAGNGATDPTDPTHSLPLQGVKVVIIHVKDPLKDGPPAGEVILAQLLEREKEAGLGCEFEVARTGGEVWV